MKNENDTKQSLGCQKLYELQVLWLEFATQTYSMHVTARLNSSD
jgi:hypothetical protein